MNIRSINDVVVRAADNRDCVRVMTLVFGVLAEYGLPPDPNGKDADLNDLEANYQRAGGVFELIEDHDGNLLGTCGLRPLDKDNCELRKMFFAPQIRGLGLGRRMLERAVSHARRQGFQVITLETITVLKEAIRLYTRFGFVPVAAKEVSARVDQAFILQLRKGANMDFQLEQAVAVLRRTPDALNTMLRDLPMEWASQNEGGTSWSPFDVVGHLIHGEETDWIPRARIILEAGETRVFDVFDRHAQFEKSKSKSLNQLLDEFARLRAESLATLAGWQLTPADLQKTGRHPEFSAVTLGQLLATWTAHDLSHLAQINRVMCRQYTQAVGPWRAYLPILQWEAK